MQALARDGLEGIFEKLREEFDFIIVDSHPVLAATDSLLIGQHVDAVILSVLREVSQMPRVYAASPAADGPGHPRAGGGGQRRPTRRKCSPFQMYDRGGGTGVTTNSAL